MVEFDKTEFWAFVDRVEYLQEFYGDYMKLPPIDERNRHLLQKIDFGPY